MLSISDLATIAVIAGGISAADIARIAQQLTPEVQPVQLTPAPRQPDPDIQAGRDWLARKAAEREREFQMQQRQQAENRRELRLERCLDLDRRVQRDLPDRR